ncbi:unnamed protein product, partial [Heterobilharzia americana]
MRHYSVTNKCSTEELTFSPSKRVIPHGYCKKDDLDWRPHNVALNPIYSDYGLDWSSKLRHIEAYKDEERSDENIWPELSSHLKTFPESNTHGLSPEWLVYTNGYSTGRSVYSMECTNVVFIVARNIPSTVILRIKEE